MGMGMVGRAVRAAGLVVVLAATLATGAPAAAGQQPRAACDTEVVAHASDHSSFGEVDISDDGSVVLFGARADLVGENADGSAELFTWHEGELAQVTDDPPSGINAVLSGDGATVLVWWRHGPTDDLTTEVERHDLEAGTVNPVVTLDDRAAVLAVDRDGSTAVLFIHRPEWEFSLHTLDVATGATTPVTPGSHQPLGGDITADGATVVYSSGPGVWSVPSSGGPPVERVSELPTLYGTPSSPGSITSDDFGHVVGVGALADVASYALAADLRTGEVWPASADTGPEDEEPASDVQPSGSGLYLWTTQQEARPYDLDMNVEVFRHGPFGTVVQVTEVRGPGYDLEAVGRDGTSALVSNHVDPATGASVDGDTWLERYRCPLFRDVGPGSPFVDDVHWLAGERATTGYADRSYRPTAPVSRAATAAFLHRLAGSPDLVPPAEPTFTDVTAAHPFAHEVEWAAAAGLVNGYDDGRFGPQRAVSRQAMAAVLHRWAGAPTPMPPAEPTFVDVLPGRPFYDEIEWAAAEGVAEGSQPGPRFRPDAPVSRQAMAAFLRRAHPLVP